jgi:uncharacterized membrane-anchored protein
MGGVMMLFILPLVAWAYLTFFNDPDLKHTPVWLYPIVLIGDISIASIVLNRMRTRLLREAGEQYRDQLARGPIPDPNSNTAIARFGLFVVAIVVAIGGIAVTVTLTTGVGKSASNRSRSNVHGENWRSGPVHAQIGSDAELEIPKGLDYLAAPGLEAYLHRVNPYMNASPEDVGIVLPNDYGWFAVLSSIPCGYVTDRDAGSLDSGKLLATLQSTTEDYGRRNRVHTLKVAGWLRPPSYYRESHRLEWAIIERRDGHPGQDEAYYVLHLTRNGAILTTLRFRNFESSLASLRSLDRRLVFTPGNAYGEFSTGEIRSTKGLADIIVEAHHPVPIGPL